MTDLKWFHENGELKGELPQNCVDECSSQGDCTASVQEWIEELDFKVDRNQAIKYLEEFGAWDTLESDSDQEITERVLWVACGDISEQGEWLGLIH
jgi:hypothetical protein